MWKQQASGQAVRQWKKWMKVMGRQKQEGEREEGGRESGRGPKRGRGSRWARGVFGWESSFERKQC